MIEYENLRASNEVFFDEITKSAVLAIESGWYILGEKVKAFEKSFAAYNHSRYCVGLANGLEALLLSLKAFDFKPGTEVIVPSNTYIATILAVLDAGCKPVLAEPDITTYNINPDEIEKKITPNTGAVMVVHLYGKCCEMDRIGNICKEHNLKLIEDCAQSHGAKVKGKYSGTFGEFGAFSFYPTKNLGALGDAGAILTDNEDLTKVISCLRNYGSHTKYYNDLIGYNSRLDEIQAAILSVKLQHLDEINEHKRNLAKLYLNNLKDDFIKPVVNPDYFDVYHIFNIRHSKRDELKKYLLDHDIKTEIHYPVPPHRQKAMKGIIDDGSYPISEEIHRTTLSLPCSFGHKESDIYRVIEVMNKF